MIYLSIIMATGTIFSIFDKVGLSFFGIFQNPGTALYGIYVMAFLFGTYSMFRVFLQKIPSFHGKPASVISFMISVISVGGIFYGKSADEIIKLFSGVTGFILMLVLSIAIIAGMYFWSKKHESGLIKTLIMSWGIFIGTAILIPVFGEFLSVLNSSKDGAGEVILGILTSINELTLFVGVGSLIFFGFSLIKTTAQAVSGTDSKEVKNIKDVNKLLRLMNESAKNSNKHFENKMNKLNEMSNMSKSNKKGNPSTDEPSGGTNDDKDEEES